MNGVAGPQGVFRTRIEWIDTDAAGIYHNSTVLRFIEAAEANLMRERGLDETFPVTPRVRYEVDLEAPLFFGQEVVTTVSLARVGTTSMTFHFEVWGESHRGRERCRAARGSYVTVHVSGDHAVGVSSVAWPEEWLRRLSA